MLKIEPKKTKVSPAPATERDYYRLAETLTTLLGWKLYDQQTGKYVKLYPCDFYSEKAEFDRLVLGVSPPPAAKSDDRRRGKPSKGKSKPKSTARRRSSQEKQPTKKTRSPRGRRP